MTRKAATTATAGVATASAGMSAAPDRDAAERLFLAGQVERMEAKVARAARDLAAAEDALSDARSRLASSTGDADG